MLTHLRIQNFKAWRDTGDLRLAPITVFFGTNSSGKTSLIQLLLLLRQTLESPDRQVVLQTTGNGRGLVDLGSFRDLLFAHDLSKSLRFLAEWKIEPDPDRPLPTHCRFEAEIAHTADREGPQVLSMAYSNLKGGSEEVPLGIRLAATGYEIHPDQELSSMPEAKQKGLGSPSQFHIFPIEIHQLFGPGVADMETSFELQFERRLSYVGPLRSRPERSYIWSGGEPGSVGADGDRTVLALLAAEDRRLKTPASEEIKRFPELIALWLERMGLIESFRLERIRDDRDDYEVILRTPGNQSEVRLMDVGFGLSQILPVVVQSFYAQPHSTVIFEQPEIHLHPRVQADLADLFLDAIHAEDENGDERNVQFLVESHSEHFLRRLQRRIAEEKLAPEEVAIYFCRPGENGAEIEELQVDDYGNITNWPDNFFGDEMGDLAAMTRAAMARQGAQPESNDLLCPEEVAGRFEEKFGT